ncbi:MAG: SAM-dependent chlorinase/fluorinase [Verrucomicrobiota bacterium]
MKSGAYLKQIACLFAALLMLPFFIQCEGNSKRNMKPLIALITDFGDADAYVPQMKGAIYSVNPHTTVVDLTHRLESFNLFEASYLIQKSTNTLPAGAIICAVIDPGVGSERKGIALLTSSGRTYIGPDNGIFTHVIQKQGVVSAVVLDNPEYYYRPEPSATFHGRDIFAPVAAHLSSGVPLETVGSPHSELIKLKLERPVIMGNKINGQITHIDHYGNVITNILRSDLPDDFENKLVKIIFNKRTLTLPVVTTYAEAPDKRLFALFNSDNELEFAIKKNSAAKTLKPKIGDPVALLTQ